MGGQKSNGSEEDILGTQNATYSPLCTKRMLRTEGGRSTGKASSSIGLASSQVVRDFVDMGFAERLVVKAIEENGEDDKGAILEVLLTYAALERFPQGSEELFGENCIFESEDIFLDDIFDEETNSNTKETSANLSEKDGILSLLLDMGYEIIESLRAIDECGPDAELTELTDFISAAQIERGLDSHMKEPPHIDEMRNEYLHKQKKMRFHQDEKMLAGTSKFHKNERAKAGTSNRYEKHGISKLPNPMVGFGVPGESWYITNRTLPEAAIGPPYFYYENVAFAPKGVWSKISRFLYDIEPEFVDSIHFCAAARKRGYIHNLPIHNRTPLMPIPPLTVQDALPSTRKWWPVWDPRVKLNCLLTCIGYAKLTERIRKDLEQYGEAEPPRDVQKRVLELCKKWNLVWVGKNKVAPLEPDEMEMLLGFPRNHTRGGGVSGTDRHKCLGNSFQVDTVGYHLSALKDQFKNGMNVLSLFSGIGGAEVALHRLGIPLKNVISVDISEVNRKIVRSWWEQTNQQGTLIEVADVQQVTAEMIMKWINEFGGFDLIIGGSPCNNLAGGNRVSRTGLEGEHSSLFFEYFRILDVVRSAMRGNL